MSENDESTSENEHPAALSEKSTALKNEDGPLRHIPDSFDRRQKFALLTLINYYLIQEKGATRQELAEKSKFVPSGGTKYTRPIDNLFTALSCDDGYCKLLAAFVIEWTLKQDRRLVILPETVIQAIVEITGAPYKSKQIDAGVDAVISSIADDRTNVEKFAANYHGVWHVFRYSAHLERDLQPKRLSENEWDAYVVQASLRIYPLGEKDEHPQFEIHYRPSSYTTFNRVLGSVISLGNRLHMHFIGHELDSEYPLTIVARQSKTRQDLFYGMVTRKHDVGDIFTAKVAFVRTTQSFDTLDAKIRPKLESVVREEWKIEKESSKNVDDIGNILKSIRNTVNYGGKSGLLL